MSTVLRIKKSASDTTARESEIGSVSAAVVTNETTGAISIPEGTSSTVIELAPVDCQVKGDFSIISVNDLTTETGKTWMQDVQNRNCRLARWRGRQPIDAELIEMDAFLATRDPISSRQKETPNDATDIEEVEAESLDLAFQRAIDYAQFLIQGGETRQTSTCEAQLTHKSNAIHLLQTSLLRIEPSKHGLRLWEHF
eukprot:Blabericola_migrator_1__5880@NODE_2979_length_2143_cov_132_835260_g1865_i0_p1_GENE_NODE_2979_length_2143_cov_132_835260_g1865_i0NODE_2979_length_2143_cov_132_835260_g1865_i0_p1_ORF_typecomplete_len197_score31_79_NODE_2979_length_2143_cov_132_835260_g1865_i08691459